MSEWIECGLPWGFHDYLNYPKPPDLKEEIIKVFGIHYSDMYNTNEKQLKSAGDIVRIIADQLIKENTGLTWMDATKKAEDSFKDTTDPDMKILLAYRKMYNDQNDYISTHPLYIEWMEKSEAHRKYENSKSFTGQKLNTTGTLIEIVGQNGNELLLIGDIDCNSGTCGCCSAISDDSIVLRYKVVYNIDNE